MEVAILQLLGTHRALASEQVAVVLHQRPYGVRDALEYLREQGLVDRVADVEAGGTPDGIRWQLTDAGREELAQWLAD
jgi:predicted ArsR family transcriptional regulator